MTTAVVGGALANKAGYGGEAWIRMSWVRGLRRLGIDAWLVEDLDSATCTDRFGAPAAACHSYNLSYFNDVAAAFGLADRAVLRVDRGKETYGAGADALARLADEAQLVVNIGGHLPAETLFPRARRVYVDIDPGWTQFWHATGDPGARLEGHHDFYTIAENLGSAGCAIPSAGVTWRTIRQPVVLDDWPVTPGPGPGRFTTVATWRNPFGPLGFGDGRRFGDGEGELGAKHHEFRRFVDQACSSRATYELALRIDPGDDADRRLLTANGWHIVDAADVARTPADFQAYVQGSGAEFSPAQGVYAHTASGWFSDRTLRYLATGRPALVQDTGLADHLPVGEGLVTFETPADALDGADRILADYPAHAAAARDIAERFFDSDVVLSGLLDEVGVS